MTTKNVEQENYAVYLQLMTGSKEKLHVGQPLQVSGYQTNSDIDLPRPCDLEVTDCDLVLQLSTGCMMLAMARRQTHTQAFSVLFKEQSFLDQG